MARVFVTGSADGLGKMAAELLIEKGHKVVQPARSTACTLSTDVLIARRERAAHANAVEAGHRVAGPQKGARRARALLPNGYKGGGAATVRVTVNELLTIWVRD
jgi:NAD(P)-dependent dehydrogenase (short-subunit alcohol dehydrogenase family)